MAELFDCFLSGAQFCERTNAIHTQLYDPRTGQWCPEVFPFFGLPPTIAPELIDPGTVLGPLRPEVQRSTGLQKTQLIAPCHHDTASAVAAVPATGTDWACLSCGAWSILATLTPEPVTTSEALAAGLNNELTLGSLFVCRNLVGLWLLQQARAAWERDGQTFSYEELTHLGEQAPPGGPLIRPNDPCFLSPPDMLEALREYCLRTGQTPPAGVPATVRCILESLALSYREGLEQFARVLARDFQALHIVGGGARNGLLCQLAADATGLPVVAGPVEATVAGNVMVQALALGHVSSPQEIREVVRASSALTEYLPSPTTYMEERYGAYQALARRQTGR
jgi:rhamnulokinase